MAGRHVRGGKDGIAAGLDLDDIGDDVEGLLVLDDFRRRSATLSASGHASVQVKLLTLMPSFFAVAGLTSATLSQVTLVSKSGVSCSQELLA